MLLWKLSVIEIPMKSLRNSLQVVLKKLMKFKESIPSAMVNMGWLRFSSPCGCSSPCLMIFLEWYVFDHSGQWTHVCWGCLELYVKSERHSSPVGCCCCFRFFFFFLTKNPINLWYVWYISVKKNKQKQKKKTFCNNESKICITSLCTLCPL